MESIMTDGQSTTLSAALRGARMLVATNDDDVAELRGLASRLRQAASDQPRAIWDLVAAYEESRQEWRNIGSREEWEADFTTLAGRLEQDEPLYATEEAALALATLCEIWRREIRDSANGLTAMRLGDGPDDEVAPRLFFAAANPPSDGEVRFNGSGAALILQDGSLVVSLVIFAAVVKSPKFITGVAAKFRLPDAAAVDIAQRRRELAKQGGAKPLLALKRDEPLEGKLDKKRGAVIFLHGLLSTDLGTFDGFIEKWTKSEPDFNFPRVSSQAWAEAIESIALCGYPHDTLVGIEQNAADLVEIMQRDFASFKHPIAFVCHSRGGLLARAVAERLFCKNERLWLPRIRAAVTFGTPHQGVEWAEYANRGMGQLVLAGVAGKATRSMCGVFDALAYFGHRGKFEGVEDLRPPGADAQSFLRRLADEESKRCPTGPRRLQVVAIGGSVGPADPPSGFLRRLARGIARRAYAFYTREEKHDLVVTLKSATAADTTLVSPSATDEARRQREVRDCDHLSYFAPDKWREADDRAVSSLRKCLNLIQIAKKKQRIIDIIKRQNPVEI